MIWYWVFILVLFLDGIRSQTFFLFFSVTHTSHSSEVPKSYAALISSTQSGALSCLQQAVDPQFIFSSFCFGLQIVLRLVDVMTELGYLNKTFFVTNYHQFFTCQLNWPSLLGDLYAIWINLLSADFVKYICHLLWTSKIWGNLDLQA